MTLGAGKRLGRLTSDRTGNDIHVIAFAIGCMVCQRNCARGAGSCIGGAAKNLVEAGPGDMSEREVRVCRYRPIHRIPGSSPRRQQPV